MYRSWNIVEPKFILKFSIKTIKAKSFTIKNGSIDDNFNIFYRNNAFYVLFRIQTLFYKALRFGFCKVYSKTNRQNGGQIQIDVNFSQS